MARQRAWAASMSLNAMARPVAREPGPLVTLVRCRLWRRCSRSGWWCADAPNVRPARAERRAAEDRAAEDRAVAEIRAIHAEHHGAYGAPRVHAELCSRGRTINRKRVARLMRINHIAPSPGEYTGRDQFVVHPLLLRAETGVQQVVRRLFDAKHDQQMHAEDHFQP